MLSAVFGALINLAEIMGEDMAGVAPLCGPTVQGLYHPLALQVKLHRGKFCGQTERNSSLIGLLFWVGFRHKGNPYERRTRETGTSAWTFLKKWKYMQDSIFSFSDMPISILLTVGLFGTLISLLFGVVVIISALAGQIDVSGYAATIIVILVFSTLQLLSMGVLGIYVWRVFENTKGRPSHIVMSQAHFSPGDLQDALPWKQQSGE